METEHQLLKALNDGDRQAGRRFYERFVGRAMSVALRYVPSREAAEDVVQDSFVRMLTSIGQFQYRGEGSLKAWASQVVANRAFDYVKEHERMTTTDHLPDLAEEPPEEDAVVENVPPDVLTRMIAQLPAGYRMVLNLYVFEHYSHSQIASRLGIKEKSSASQLARARKMLRTMMNEYLKQQQST